MNGPHSISDLHFDAPGKRWVVQNFNKGNVTVSEAEIGHLVYIGSCKDTTVIITSEKINKLVIDACSNTKVALMGTISGVEIVRCEKIEVRAQKRMPTLQIDLCKGIDVYIVREFINVKLVTSNSMDVKFHVPKDGKDSAEWDSFVVPASAFLEQRVTQFTHNNKLELALVTASANQLKKEDYLVIHSPQGGHKEVTIPFEFSIHYNTKFGEMLFVAGSIPLLGNWNVGEAKKMEWNEGGWWKLSFSLPPTSFPFEYKYVMANVFTKEIRWEQSPNRVLKESPSSNKVADVWGVVNDN